MSPLGYIVVSSWTTLVYTANDQADGLGTDRTASIVITQTKFANSQKLSIHNTYAGTVYLTSLSANGIAVIESDPTKATAEDPTSITADGDRTFEYPGGFISSATEAQAFCDHFLAICKDESSVLDLTLKAHVNANHATEAQRCDISDKIHVHATSTTGLYIDADYFVERINHRLDVNGSHEMTLQCSAVPAHVWGASAISYTPATITTTDIIDLVLPSAPLNGGVTADGVDFIVIWDDPATGGNTLDDVCIQYASDTGFSTDVTTRIGWGKINTKRFSEPNKNYYFRLAWHNQSGIASNAATKAIIEGAGMTATYGWGPFCTYFGSASTDKYGTLDLKPMAMAQYGVFNENFEEGVASERNWTFDHKGTLTYPANGIHGATTMKSVGHTWPYTNSFYPYNPGMLYRMTARARRTTPDPPPESTKMNIYIGVHAYDAAKSYLGNIWIAANAVDASLWVLNVWYDETTTPALLGWFKDTGTGGTGTASDPFKLPANTAYFRVTYIVNHDEGATNAMEIDSITIGAFDFDGQKRLYSGLTSTGTVETDKVVTASVTDDNVVNAHLVATAVAIDGGDPSGADVVIGSLTQDSDWHDLDLSSFIPARYRFVCIRFYGISLAGGAVFKIRTNGNANDFNTDLANTVTSNAGEIVAKNMICMVDANRVIEYWCYGWNSGTYLVVGPSWG
jgi:hypothetical protein